MWECCYEISVWHGCTACTSDGNAALHRAKLSALMLKIHPHQRVCCMGMQLRHTLKGYVEAGVRKAALEQARASMGLSMWRAKGFHVTCGMRLQLR